MPADQVNVVVAHEVAHEANHDVLHGTLLGAAGIFTLVNLLGLADGAVVHDGRTPA